MTTISKRAHPTLQFDRVAWGLHWLIAAMIVAALGPCLLADTFPSGWEDGILNARKLIGFAVLCLVVLRLVWKVGRKAEPPSWVLERAASLSHILLYCLMVAVPLIGLAFAAWSGQGINFGFFLIAPTMEEDEAATRQIEKIHELVGPVASYCRQDQRAEAHSAAAVTFSQPEISCRSIGKENRNAAQHREKSCVAISTGC